LHNHGCLAAHSVGGCWRLCWIPGTGTTASCSTCCAPSLREA